MSKPSMTINLYDKTVTVAGELMNLNEFQSSAEFAETVVTKLEYLWDADTVNETRRDLVKLYYAIMEG